MDADFLKEMPNRNSTAFKNRRKEKLLKLNRNS